MLNAKSEDIPQVLQLLQTAKRLSSEPFLQQCRANQVLLPPLLSRKAWNICQASSQQRQSLLAQVYLARL